MNSQLWKYAGRPCESHLVESEDGQWNIARVESKEAALLIAAAPELFLACVDALNALPKEDHENGTELFWKLKNAIRKAERGK